MALTISVDVSTTYEGYAHITLKSTFNTVAYCKIKASPYEKNGCFNYSDYELAPKVLQPGETISFSVTLPKTQLKEWFGEFYGGRVKFTATAYSSESYRDVETIGMDYSICLFWGKHANGLFGLMLLSVKDTIYNSSVPTVKYIRGHNYINCAFEVKVLDTTRTIENINIYTTYNLVETNNNPAITDDGSGTYSCTVKLPNVSSPNIKFNISINYSYQSITTQYVTSSIYVKTSLSNLQDYQRPIIYAEVTSPMTGTGDCTIGVTGRYQATFLDTYNEKISNALSGFYEIWEDGVKIVSNGSLKVTETEDGLFTGAITLGGLDYNEPYAIVIWVQDLLGLMDSSRVELTNRPVFDWNHHDFSFNVPVYHQKSVILQTDESIGGMYDGTTKSVFTPQDNTGNTVIGYDNFSQENGNTLIYGNNVDIMAHEDVTINGESIVDLIKDTSTPIISETITNEVPTIVTDTATDVVTQALSNRFGNVLWEGSNRMGSRDTTITLSDKFSNQVSGIVLVFSRYDADNWPVSWNSFFVSKDLISGFDPEPIGQFGGGHTFLMANNSALSVFGAKYLFFLDDDTIAGHVSNSQSGTAASGITFSNAEFYLRYVIGV